MPAVGGEASPGWVSSRWAGPTWAQDLPTGESAFPWTWPVSHAVQRIPEPRIPAQTFELATSCLRRFFRGRCWLRELHQLPVVQNGALVGVVTRADVMSFMQSGTGLPERSSGQTEGIAPRVKPAPSHG
jgi:hypothetical protein